MEMEEFFAWSLSDYFICCNLCCPRRKKREKKPPRRPTSRRPRRPTKSPTPARIFSRRTKNGREEKRAVDRRYGHSSPSVIPRERSDAFAKGEPKGGIPRRFGSFFEDLVLSERPRNAHTQKKEPYQRLFLLRFIKEKQVVLFIPRYARDGVHANGRIGVPQKRIDGNGDISVILP